MTSGTWKTRVTPKRGRRAPRNRSRKSKKGLNKVEVKQTKAIANKVLMKAAESKYFNCLSIDNLTNDGANTTNRGQLLIPSGQVADTNYRVMVKAYATTTVAKGGSPTDQFMYGLDTATQTEKPMLNLQLAQRTVVDDHGNKMDGQYCMPAHASLALSITRHYSTIVDELGTSYMKQGPIRFRVINVVPRTSRGTNQASGQEHDPQTDLFVNELGNPIGVKSVLSIYDIAQYKVNGRRYKVKMDKTFTLNCPVNFDASAPSSLSIPGNKFDEHLRFKFELGKKLFYLNDTDTAPTAGATNEFILVHAWYPVIRNENLEAYDMGPILLGGKAVSTFKDI